MIISGTGSFLTKIHAQGFPVTPVTLRRVGRGDIRTHARVAR